jgi:hypothetical protein
MVGTKPSGWRSIHHFEHTSNSMSRSIHYSSDLCSVGIKYIGLVLSFVSSPSRPTRTFLTRNSSGYDLLNGQPGRAVGDCWSSLTSGQTITYLASATNGVVQTSLAVNASTSISAIQIRGWNVETGVPKSSSISPVSSATASTSGSSSGLSTGAKAGIGVGIAVAVILILALAGALLVLRRRSRAAQHNLVSPLPAVQDRSDQIHEKAATPAPSELPSKQPSIRSPLPKSPVEMPSEY